MLMLHKFAFVKTRFVVVGECAPLDERRGVNVYSYDPFVGTNGT